MVFFPNSKINLGLNVIAKRPDGYHNIETVFYPILWQDALEIIENQNTKPTIEITQSGITIDSKMEDNLIYKAWTFMSQIAKIPPIKVHLHKNIPMGAGLGGGSADAAFFINMLNSKFDLNISLNERLTIASKIGSDCAFFINNTPVFAKGKGNEFEELTLDLTNYYILLVYPNIHSNTKEAYDGLIPKLPEYDLKTTITSMPIEKWKDFLTNDFEETIFRKYHLISELKDLMYQNNALFASMSGSGSTVFGIFKKEPKVVLPQSYKWFLQRPAPKI